MNNNILIRKESFGGTLFIIGSGKRLYINNNEYSEIKENSSFPKDIIPYLPKNYKIFIKEPQKLPSDNFSFADNAYFELTKSCNLKCIHCLNDSGVKSNKQLTNEECINTVKSLCNNGIQEIRFTGGEPLLHSGLFKLVEIAHDMGVRTSLGTNGTLIDGNVAKKLQEAGLDHAVISLDGTSHHHNIIRGVPNSYENARKSIDFLNAHGVTVRVNSVVMKSNMQDIVELSKILSNEGIHLLIRRFIPSGRGKNLHDEVLTLKDYESLKKDLDKYIKTGLVDGHHIVDDEIRTRIELPFVRNSCSAGQRGIVIRYDGIISYCGFLYESMYDYIGDVKSYDLSIIWQKIINSDFLKNSLENINKFNSSHDIKTNCIAYVNHVLEQNIEHKL